MSAWRRSGSWAGASSFPSSSTHRRRKCVSWRTNAWSWAICSGRSMRTGTPIASPFSNTRVSTPAIAVASAAQSPAAPAPTTMTS